MVRKDDDSTCSINFASTTQHSILGNMYKNSTPTSSFQQRKQPRDADTVFPFQTSAKANRSRSLLVISSEEPSLATNKAEDVDNKTARNPVILPSKCTRGSASSGCNLGEEISLVVDLRCAVVRNLDNYLVNESCSSSKSNMDLCAPTMKTEADDAGECSFSGAFIKNSLFDDISEKDIRNFVIRSLGLQREVCSIRTSVYPKVSGFNSECSCVRPCKVCDQPEITLKMLICDQCEEAYHISCCYPPRRKLPLNEWFCHLCLKKKHKIPKELTAKGPLSYSSEMRKGGTAISRGALGPIAAMLEDAEPYTTSVRIGLEFQAEVPDWSGPLTNKVDNYNEPLEMSLAESFQEGNSRKPSKVSSICNWLQCQDIISGIGEGVDGVVCGKWRRAPLFEVQSKKWECFRSVLWDPAHADCAVPQEVDTDRVLKDLKYLEMLKPRLAAKKRKLGCKYVDSDEPDHHQDEREHTLKLRV